MVVRALFVFVLALSVGCLNQLEQSDLSAAEGTTTEHVIVGSVDWMEIGELADNSPERTNSHAVAYLSLPSVGSRCTGFLIAPDVIMTNEHCVSSASEAQGVTAIFGREAHAPYSTWATYSCSTFLGDDRELDYALLQCTGRPGDVFGVVELDPTPASTGEDLYVVHQNCDYYSSPGCEPSKKYSAGRVTRVNSEVKHNADTLGGSSGSPVFRAGNHKVFALHHVGLGNNGDGRGTGNYAVPMSRIVPELNARFPELPLGGAEPAGPVEADAFEPNDNPAAASEVALPFAGQRSIHEGDADFLRFTLAAPSEVLVEMHLNNSLGDLDVYLTRDGETAPLARGASTEDLETFSLPLEAGAYLLHVAPYQGASNDYTLSVRATDDSGAAVTPSGEAFEPNEDPDTAAAIPAPFAWDDLSIASATDLDHYRLNVAGAVSIELNFAHADGDLDLVLLDAAGNQTARSDSASDNELIQLDLPEGAYTLRVYGYQGATGSYGLRVD